MKKARRTTRHQATKHPEQNPRDDIGLTAAYEGDLRGLIQFTGFAKIEFLNLAMSPEVPAPIQVRCRALMKECSDFADYLQGFRDGNDHIKLKRRRA